MKLSKAQNKIIKKYAKENGLTVEQVINYMVSIIEQEMDN
jgi:hypothetical protein